MPSQILNDSVEDEPSLCVGLTLDIEISSHCLGENVDWSRCIRQAVEAALAGSGNYNGAPVEIYIEFAPDSRSQELNFEYRGKNTPTNVLSFPGIEPDDLQDSFDFAKNGGPPAPLGDLIIADAVIIRESVEQKKPVEHHLAHLVVHGVLHLLGYDHIEDVEAEEMEALERRILAGLEIPDPY